MTSAWPPGDDRPPPPPPPPPYGQQGYGPPPTPPQSYGQPGGYAAQTTYGQAPYGGYGYPSGPAQPTTNPLAIVSLVAGIVGCFLGVSWIAAIICGFIAKNQIRNSQGAQKGSGMATAGIVLGFAWLVLVVLYVVFVVVLVANSSSTSSDFNSLGLLPFA